MDNSRDSCATVLEVEVQDYPGLLGVLAWVLNGLDVMARNALVRTTPEGMAHNCFWLTGRSGRKLRDDTAAMLADRVRDYVMYCTPPPEMDSVMEWRAGNARVSNAEHDRCTVVTVTEEDPKPGYLLEIASVLSGLNMSIQKGIIQGADGDTPSTPPRQRLHRFWIKNNDGGKLTREQISGLIFTLNLMLSPKGQPLKPPDNQVLWSFAN